MSSVVRALVISSNRFLKQVILSTASAAATKSSGLVLLATHLANLNVQLLLGSDSAHLQNTKTPFCTFVLPWTSLMEVSDIVSTFNTPSAEDRYITVNE